MLDQGITFRCLLAWATGTAAVVLLVASWLCGWDNVGRTGLVLMALACTQWMLQDNAKTRRCVRAVMRPDDGRATVSRVP